MEIVKAPEVGIYHDVAFAAYTSWDACNFSALKVLREFSPMHYKLQREAERKVTQALKRGSALHAAVLEPAEFEANYITGAVCSATKKGDGKPCTQGAKVMGVDGKWYCGTHAPAETKDFPGEILTEADMRMVRGIAQSVAMNPVANAFVNTHNRDANGRSLNEVCIVWNDPDTGIPCKARIDMARPVQWGSLGDLKTTTNASPHHAGAPDTIGDYWYDGQAAWYMQGWELAGGEPVAYFNFFMLEKQFPFGVGSYKLDALSVHNGWLSTRKWVKQYANCWRNNHWWGYDDAPVTTGLSPRTAHARHRELQEQGLAQ